MQEELKKDHAKNYCYVLTEEEQKSQVEDAENKNNDIGKEEMKSDDMLSEESNVMSEEEERLYDVENMSITELE